MQFPAEYSFLADSIFRAIFRRLIGKQEEPSLFLFKEKLDRFKSTGDTLGCPRRNVKYASCCIESQLDLFI